MPNPRAVLVEDDPVQSEFSSGIIRTAGFDVMSFASIDDAIAYIESPDELVDLFVLDRRLPLRDGEPATDEFGDELLRQVRESFPDARVIAFTGYASVRHVQDAVRGSGQLPSRAGEAIDRITVLEKDQSIEFREHVEAYRALLQSLADIEVVGQDGVAIGAIDRRVLQRVAFGYGAVSLNVYPLAGGLTGAPVWHCELRREEGVIAVVVAKQVEFSPVLGGLSELLPIAYAPAIVASLTGLMGGRVVNVIQVAGDAPQSLMSVIETDAQAAGSLVELLRDALGSVPDRDTTVPLNELCTPLISWAKLTENLDTFGVQPPSGTLNATVRIGRRHGDLHPSNVLVCDGTPVLIDFDSECFSAGLLDPITLLLSTLTHPESPLRGAQWPGVEEINASFGTPGFAQAHPKAAWFGAVKNWISNSQASEREFWGLSLAFGARQLRYKEVRGDPETLDRVVAIVRLASERLMGS